ncbi:O-antigen ligase family protein [Naasia sp. SYSU D00948]|uniref:O-antigen ligase family protein n=1 Tax=Naasia sp. SYSU D00948 TaxID=2817379 RepID=UPI001B3121D8|nr:O-antigen ligase family protein [Naasia sp. SYSU D00948]
MSERGVVTGSGSGLAEPLAADREEERGWRPWRTVGIAALAALVFVMLFPAVVSRYVAVPYVVFTLLWVYAVTALMRREGLGARLAVVIAAPALVFAATYYVFSLPPVLVEPLGVLPAVIRAYLLVPPLAIVAGALLLRDPVLPLFLRMLRIGAAVLAVLALVEHIRGSFLFPGGISEIGLEKFTSVNGDSFLGGGVRAVVATEHPLVLAAILATTLPITLARVTALRLAEALLLLLGIAATDSAGPFGLGIIAVLIVLLVPRSIRSSALVRPSTAAIAFTGMVVLCALLATFVWEPAVDERAGVDASTQYRFALYALAPDILADYPLGYGIGEKPAGVLLLEHNGIPLDVSKTVDSELVLLMIQFGIVGALAFLTVLWLGVRRLAAGGEGRLLSAMLVMLTACGLFLALHTWSGLAPLWEILIGAVIATHRSPRKGDPAVSPSEGQ